MKRRAWGIVATICVITGCSSPQESELDRSPAPATHQVHVYDHDGLNLPLTFTESELIDPQWDTEGQYADGVYLGAQELSTHLEFTAISATGEALWSVDRPLSCTGFTLMFTSDGQALAVLGDTDSSDDALAATSVTAYDLHTGELVWGPVDVPGPYIGPGLVYGDLHGGTLGEAGPRIALNADTGEIRVEDRDNQRIVGEYDSLIVSVVGQELQGDSATGQHWTIDLAEYGITPEDVLPDMNFSAGSSEIFVKSTSSGGLVIDKASGEVLFANVAEAAHDPVSLTWAIRDETALHSYDGDGVLMWSQSIPESTHIVTAGASLVYLRDGDTLQARNLYTGAVAQAYLPEATGTIVVPAMFTDNGSGLLWVDGRQVIATIEEIPAQ